MGSWLSLTNDSMAWDCSRSAEIDCIQEHKCRFADMPDLETAREGCKHVYRMNLSFDVLPGGVPG